MIFDEIDVFLGEKNIDLTEKFQKCPKITHVLGIPSKGQPQAPHELGDIQNLAKTFFV